MPIPILTVEQVRAAEAEANRSGIGYEEMMQRAGRALAVRLGDLLAESGAPPDDWRVTFLIGPGNNGGDGLVAGRLLAAEWHAAVRFYLLKPRAEDDPHLRAVQDAGLLVALANDDQRFRVLQQMASTSLILVDALFGIGARLPLDETTRKLLNTVKHVLDAVPEAHRPYAFADQPARAAGHPKIVAVDCPSGLDCDTGALDEAVLPADETLTMIAAKPGLLRFPGAAAVGRLAVADLGVPKAVPTLMNSASHLFTAEDAAALLPPRGADSHKGTFGQVLVAGGSANYPGAPSLSARAAYRMGAGLVSVAVPGPIVAWLAGALPECTWVHLPDDLGVITGDGAPILRESLSSADALVLGMGLGRDVATREFLARLLETDASASRPSMGFGRTAKPARESDSPALPPLVLDADGLSLLSELPDWSRLLPPDTILTPHPGEMARLCKSTVQDVTANRWDLAKEKAAEWGVVLVLKGAHTAIASPDGRLRVLPFKTSALATAGTGDVLAGMIGTLRGQGLSAFDAAATAAYIHGIAGQRAAESVGCERPVMAGDVIEAIAGVLASLGR